MDYLSNLILHSTHCHIQHYWLPYHAYFGQKRRHQNPPFTWSERPNYPTYFPLRRVDDFNYWSVNRHLNWDYLSLTSTVCRHHSTQWVIRHYLLSRKTCFHRFDRYFLHRCRFGILSLLLSYPIHQ